MVNVIPLAKRGSTYGALTVGTTVSTVNLRLSWFSIPHYDFSELEPNILRYAIASRNLVAVSIMSFSIWSPV